MANDVKSYIFISHSNKIVQGVFFVLFKFHLYYFRFAIESVNEPYFEYKCKVPELCIEEQKRKFSKMVKFPSHSENEKKKHIKVLMHFVFQIRQMLQTFKQNEKINREKSYNQDVKALKRRNILINTHKILCFNVPFTVYLGVPI